MTNSAIDSSIRNDGCFLFLFLFSLKHRGGKGGKFISFWHETKIVPRNKRTADLNSRNATQGISKEHGIVSILLNVSNWKLGWSEFKEKYLVIYGASHRTQQ